MPRSVLVSDPADRLEFQPRIYVKASGKLLSGTLGLMSRAELEAVGGFLSSGVSVAGTAAPSGAAAYGSISARGSAAVQGAASAPSVKGGISPEALMDFAGRTTSLALGISDPGKASAAAELVAVGDFPSSRLKLAIAASGAWKKTGQGWESRLQPLYIRPLEPGIIHLSTLRQASAPSAAGRAKPLPDRFARLIREDLVFFTDSPGLLLPGGISAEPDEFPFVSIFATAGISGNGGYLLDFYIQMKDETAARTFRPVVRFLWVAAAGRIFGGNVDSSLYPPVQEGDCYVSRGIPLPAEALKDIILSSAAGI